tara:strand:+ start:366 stop:593 length:228 start_codon:yes stop_codon:yes gene_type:complete
MVVIQDHYLEHVQYSLEVAEEVVKTLILGLQAELVVEEQVVEMQTEQQEQQILAVVAELAVDVIQLKMEQQVDQV